MAMRLLARAAAARRTHLSRAPAPRLQRGLARQRASARASRVCVVQGASGGLGSELVRQLASRGDVVVAASRAPEASATLLALRDAFPRAVSLLQLDACDDQSVAQAAERVAREHGGAIDALYNFGGLLHNPATGLKPETKLSQVQAGNMATVFAVNCTAPMLTLRAFAPLLQAGGAEAEGERGPAVAATLSARVGSISDNGAGPHAGCKTPYRPPASHRTTIT